MYAGLSHHWLCGNKRLIFPILKFHFQLHQYVYLEIRPIHGMRIHDLGICLLQGNDRVFINDFTKHDSWWNVCSSGIHTGDNTADIRSLF